MQLYIDSNFQIGEQRMGKGWGRVIVAGLVLSNAAFLGLWQLERSRPSNPGKELRWLAERLATAEARSEQLGREKRQVADAAAGMTQRLKTRTVKAAVRNASSVIWEAAPYVGIPVMLGVTALDLKDACDTMHDINALHSVLGAEQADTKEVCGLSVPSREGVRAQLRKLCGKMLICREEQLPQ